MEDDIKYILDYFDNLKFVSMTFDVAWSDAVLTVSIARQHKTHVKSCILNDGYLTDYEPLLVSLFHLLSVNGIISN